MNGSIAIPFSTLFNDTVSRHGYRFALRYYVIDKGMSLKEFGIWARGAKLASSGA